MRYHKSGLSPEALQASIAQELVTYVGMTPVGEKWSDDTTPRTGRPVRFYRAFTPGGNSRKHLYPSRIHA